MCSPDDLWMALGGNSSLEGSITLESIFEILKREFDISEGVEAWLSEVEH